MRDPRRIERILALIKEIWILQPDQRLGQLLGNYGMPEARQGPMWWIEDDAVEAQLRGHLIEMAAVLVARRGDDDE